MLEWFTNMDLSTKLILGLIVYALFPQFWPKIKELLGNLKLSPSNPSSPELLTTLEEKDLSKDAERLLTWLTLYQNSEHITDPKLKKTLLELPALLVEKKDV